MERAWTTGIARGPIPIDEALAKQIAEALEAAHEKGIIHRDLKPANIALTKDGNVKVLDFGLAKATDSPSGASVDAMNSPTITSPAMMTGVGVILGTAAYMSPEQAKGRAADKHSDIWAFGCVLYEMLTGKRAFNDDDVSTTLAALLKTEPDWTLVSAATPSDLRRLLSRCLKKDPRDRLRAIGDARVEIGELVMDDATRVASDGASRASVALKPSRAQSSSSLRRALPWTLVGPVHRGAAVPYACAVPAAFGGRSDSTDAAREHRCRCISVHRGWRIGDSVA
jgi:serine/threonine protein kinase